MNKRKHRELVALKQYAQDDEQGDEPYDDEVYDEDEHGSREGAICVRVKAD